MNENYGENPHPLAKSVFILWTPFHYYVLKNIAKHLPYAEFAICPMWCFPRAKNASNLKKIIHLLRRDNAHWRICTDINNGTAAKDFFRQYETIVAIRLWSPLTKILYYGVFPEKRYVLVSYGVGKDLVTASPWSSFFDVVLSEGEHTHNIYKTLNNSHIVGVPKYDDWFEGTMDKEAVGEIKKKLDPAKKTVLYLPTHGPTSSIRFFAKAVGSLANSYNCAVKLHYLNDTVDAQCATELRSFKNVLVFDDDEDILPLFSATDIVMSDSSSAALETLLVEKPLIILDAESYIRGKVNDNEEIWLSSLQFYKKSIEQRIKNEDNMRIGLVVKDPAELPEAVERAEAEYLRYGGARERLRKYLFAYTDGKSGQRAAEIIRSFAMRQKPEPPLAGLATHLYLMDRFIEWRKRK